VAFSVADYDMLERAIVDGSRLAIRRRGSEFLVIPVRLRLVNGREVIHARHPSTGHQFELFIDELDSIERVQ
jgi:hypothetical protein